jgi:hypothetical protein
LIGGGVFARLVDGDRAEVTAQLLLDRLDLGRLDLLNRAVGAGDEVGEADDERLELTDAISERGNLIERADQGVPLQVARLRGHLDEGFAELVAFEPLVPEVEDQHLGEELLVLAPPAIALADADENLHQEGAVEVVHQLDERAGRGFQLLRIVAGRQFAARDVQIAALAEQLAKLRREVGEVEG